MANFNLTIFEAEEIILSVHIHPSIWIRDEGHVFEASVHTIYSSLYVPRKLIISRYSITPTKHDRS